MKFLFTCIELVEKLGFREAVLLDHFIFWTCKNEIADINYHDGRYWTFQTQKELCGLFDVSEDVIYYNIKKLVKHKLLIISNYNKNRYDHTNWYSVDFKRLADMGFAELRDRAIARIKNHDEPTAETPAPAPTPANPSALRYPEDVEQVLAAYPSRCGKDDKAITKKGDDERHAIDNLLVRYDPGEIINVINYMVGKKDEIWVCGIVKFAEEMFDRLNDEYRQDLIKNSSNTVWQ